MTHLGTTLAALIDDHWPSQRAFAEACGINHATLHHVLNGRPCSRENLRLFCQHVSKEPKDRYAVLIAHLEDEAAASGLDTTQLVIRTVDEITLSELQIDGALKRQLALVGDEASRFKDVRVMLNSLAEMIEASRARSGNVYPFHKDKQIQVAEDGSGEPPTLGAKKPSPQPPRTPHSTALGDVDAIRRARDAKKSS